MATIGFTLIETQRMRTHGNLPILCQGTYCDSMRRPCGNSAQTPPFFVDIIAACILFMPVRELWMFVRRWICHLSFLSQPVLLLAMFDNFWLLSNTELTQIARTCRQIGSCQTYSKPSLRSYMLLGWWFWQPGLMECNMEVFEFPVWGTFDGLVEQWCFHQVGLRMIID